MAENISETKIGPPNKILGARHSQVMLLFLANIICCAFRNNLNIALIAMTDKNNDQYFDISLKIQSTLQSSFFWGFFVGLLPAGEMITRYGAKRFLILCLLVNSVASFAIPFSSLIGPNGWIMIYGCRILQGIFQGFLMPAILTLLSKWIPEDEKCRMVSFTYSGSQLGNAVQLLTSGYIAHYWGWQSIFYFFGIMGISWILIFAMLGAESPAEIKYISKEERIYITTFAGYSGKSKKLRTPWKHLMTSMPFMATIVGYCGFKWGFYTLLTVLPTYMKEIHGVNLRENGQLSALPYLALFISLYPTGCLADFILNKKWFELTTIRKIFTTIGFIGPSIWLLALAQVNDKVLAVLFLTLGVASNAAAYCGFLMNHLDMAPNFPGSMNAIANVFSNVTTILAPIVAGFLLGDGTDISKWQTVFYLAVGFYMAANIFYLIFGDSRVQPWNDPDYKKKKELTI